MNIVEKCIKGVWRFDSFGSPATITEITGIKIPLHRNLASPIVYGVEGEDVVVFEVTDEGTLMFHTLQKKQTVVIARNRLHGVRVPDYSVVERIALDVPKEGIDPQQCLPKFVKRANAVCRLGEEQDGIVIADMPMLKTRLKPEQCTMLSPGQTFLLGISLDLAARMALGPDATNTESPN